MSSVEAHIDAIRREEQARILSLLVALEWLDLAQDQKPNGPPRAWNAEAAQQQR